VAAAAVLTLLAAPARAADFTVTATHDAGDGVCDATCTLRDAIAQTGASDRVILPAGEYQLAQGALELTGDTIVGAGARTTTIEGQDDRVLYVTEDANQVSGVTITGGESFGAPFSAVGGGILVRFPGVSLTLVESTVRENEALQGGGIANLGTLTVVRSTVSQNTAFGATNGAEGGGIYSEGTTTLQNSTVSGNLAVSGESSDAAGGGIYVDFGTFVAESTTVAANQADIGSAIYRDPSGSVTLSHTIVDNGGGPLFACFGAPFGGDTNIVDHDSCGPNPADPLLGPLADYGGPTDTHAITDGLSPAVDGGNDCEPIDQRGFSRVNDCDIGAFEFGAGAEFQIVNTTEDHVPDGCDDLANGDCTLREAVTQDDATLINLADDGPYELEEELVIGRSLAIIGVAHDLAEIGPAVPSESSRLLSIATGRDVQLIGLRITGGDNDNGLGGGIFVATGANLIVEGSEIVGNTAASGGGIWHAGDALTLLSTTVAGNVAEGDGVNDLGRGGGVALAPGSEAPRFMNTTFSGNRADGLGGGIYTQRSMDLMNVSIVDNQAPPRGPEDIGKGGGLYQAFTGIEQTTASNTLLAENVNGGCGGTQNFPIASTRGLLDELGTTLPSCNVTNPGDNIIDDAVIGPLAENGGRTRTHALLPGSPAINAGGDPCHPFDQRGIPRPADETWCDIGAFEVELSAVNTFADDGTPAGCTPAHCTLRERVDEASMADVIVLQAGTYELTRGEPLALDAVLAILGAGARATTIDANGLSRIGYVAENAVATIGDVTITGGDADASDEPNVGEGGAFFVDGSSVLVLTQAALTGNVASFKGGAISNYGVLQFINSLASGNRAGSAGTAGRGGAIATESDLQSILVQNSTLSGNTAVPNTEFPSQGGGIWLEHDVQLTHLTITGNAATEGAGLFDASGDSSIVATLIAGNDGPECGDPSISQITESHNLSDDTSCAFDGVGDLQGVDPRLAPLANNGGPTNTHALYTGSPAINAADCDPGPGTDQRLEFRAPGPCDIGAYEGSVDPPSSPPPAPPQGGGGGTTQLPPEEEQELPSPEAGETVNALPARGTVKIRLPGTNRFVELEEGQQIPVGTVIDATKGRVTLVAAGGQQATFYDGIFKIGQGKGAKPLTTLTLVEALSCPKAGNAVAAAKKKKKKRRLWGDGSGKFRTKGKHSAATVVGTKWLVEDKCTSTLTRVVRGRVSVRDFVKKKTVIVRAGKKYVARAKKK
jgi:CSLREA domain-containing protein